MIKNYIKIAWKVLLRHKIFTFISLFGISFTLFVLMLVTAAVDHIFTPGSTGSTLDRTTFVERIEFSYGQMRGDCQPSYDFLDKNVRSLTGPELVSIHSTAEPIVNYVNGHRVTSNVMYTDSYFWDILGCEFLEGAPYGKSAVDNAEPVAVINRTTARQYFGDESAIGKYISTDETRLRIVGVVQDQDIPLRSAYADIYAPVTAGGRNPRMVAGGWGSPMDNYMGTYAAFVLAHSKSDFPALQAEFQRRIEFVLSQDPELKLLKCRMGTMVDYLAGEYFGDDLERGKLLMMAAIALAMVLFMLLPAVNLVNINLSRIIERSSEIGVRKAFGASSMTLVGQFIVENVILTLLGGGIGLILADVTLRIVTASGVIPYGRFAVNFEVFFYSLLISLFFGLFSGVYPAFKMARLQPVEALKGASL
jgi:putative ABC transport system permease protein